MIRCDCGRSHWGRYGAAGLLLLDETRDRVLLQLRSGAVLSPHTWALPGGALERGETPTDAALRESHEEVGLDPECVRAEREIPGLIHPQWRYTYVLATTTTTTIPRHSSWEVEDHRWIAVDDVAERRGLLGALARDWVRLVGEIGM